MGYEERKELALFAISNVRDNHNIMESHARDNLNVLVAVQEEKLEVVKELLTFKVKSGLSFKRETGPLEVEGVTIVDPPNEILHKKAREYQEKYCSNNCLGL